MELDRDCNECGANDWTKVVQDEYPERRKERDRTVKKVYHCQECGAEGRRFDRQETGTRQYSGALR